MKFSYHLFLDHANDIFEKIKIVFIFRDKHRDIRGGPGAQTSCCQWNGPRFDPWSGSEIPHV